MKVLFSKLLLGVNPQANSRTIFLRRLASSISQVYSQKIDKNLELRSPDPILSPRNRRPLVILFGWMLAQPKNLNKFGDVYIEKGFDVLNVQVQPLNILLPSNAQKVVQKILNYVEFDCNLQQPIIIHGFSVGGYLHGELLVKLNSDQNRFPSTRNRFIGQVFDSPVHLDGISRGFSNILLTNRIMRSMFEKMLETYLRLFKNRITRHYRAAQDQFFANHLQIPSLLLYSTSDPITDTKVIEKVVEGYTRRDIQVFWRCWNDSGHVLHMKKHSEEYFKAIDDFMNTLQLNMAKHQSNSVLKEERLRCKAASN